MVVLLCVSVSEADSQWLIELGPRRDYVELANLTGGEILYGGRGARSGALGRLVGQHVRLAWRAAHRCAPGDAIYADGEHVGIPLLALLALLRRKPNRVVMLGHLPGRSWKRWLLSLVTRLGTPGLLLVHSIAQARLVEGSLGRRWQLRVFPYHVDTEYWRASRPPRQEAQPLVLAVGSEHRDYETLARAAEGLPTRIVIAAGSHWARSVAGAGSLPRNVEYLDEALRFRELRERYADASVVVVPLREVPNQSGITTLLEAMSMAAPVVVSANGGQRECLRGPLVDGSGHVSPETTADRGPHIIPFWIVPRAATSIKLVTVNACESSH